MYLCNKEQLHLEELGLQVVQVPSGGKSLVGFEESVSRKFVNQLTFVG